MPNSRPGLLPARLRLKPLKEQVIVITGASSGIGLETALLAAEKGAKVVLASRHEPALREAVDKITQAGGQARYVVADVCRRGEVAAIAQIAKAEFGRVDTWINNAGVKIYSQLTEGSEEDDRQLFEINFWGVYYGSLEALPLLKEGGALINVGSIASDQAFPLQGIYSASKHAVKAFTDALRMEVEHEHLPISVTLIKPSTIATPLAEHALNNLPHEVRLAPPLYQPREAALAILHAAVHPARDVVIGGGGRLLTAAAKVAPRLLDLLGEKRFYELQQGEEPAQRRSGNLYRPQLDGRVEGQHDGQRCHASAYTRARMHPLLTAGLGLAGVFALLALRPRRRGGSRPPAR